ncbi:MAG: chitobiase/beta-hexosaminidase C-terminal domain-containing protein, partial [Candidatus Zophobacter franzmannii]|nr:chitobiase/beta-hexosaminidase C-terminal domain-containing protein [Candidatus Zophobacter franzmannii]
RSYDVVLPIVSTPYFTPGAGIYSETQSVEVFCSTVGASIYYTLDGTDPDETSSLYSVALSITETTTVKAIAYMVGYGPSTIAEALYDFAVAGPANIYISEYIEGSSNNKAIELYNAGDTDVNLGFVEFWRISNDGFWDPEGMGNSTTLSGTLAPGDVYVVCNSSAIPEIQALSDLVGTSVCYFNGDDPMGLVYNGILVDTIGEEGPDIGTGWEVAGTAAATANHTIIRKLTGAATTDWALSAGTDVSDSEWIVFEQDDYSNLGSPTPDTNPVPSITNVVYLPMAPLPTEAVVVTADITDDDSIDTAVLNWGLASDALSNPIAMTITRENYTATIPAQADGATVYFNIVATDLVASIATSATMDYAVSYPTVDDPTFNPATGTYTETQTVEILCATVGATIYYTLDGTDPDETSALYSVALTVSETTTVKAKAYLVDYTDSAIVEAIYTISTLPTPNIYISEYLEGSSNNKAFEIYNADIVPVDLSMVQVWRISNGGDWAEGAGNATTLVGTLNPGEVWVNCNSGSIPEIIALADSVGSSITWFNGDDAMGLAYNGVLIDVVGDEGVDPGSGWDVAGVTNATANHTLLRKSSVTSGTTDWALSAGTDASDSQWIVLDVDNYSNLSVTTANFNEFPGISNITVNPAAPEVGMNVTISADVTDDSAVSSVELQYGIETGVYGTTVAMNTRATYSTILTTLTAGTYYFIVVATDDASAVTTSDEQSFTVTEPVATEGIIVIETALDFTATVGETSDVQEYTLQGVDLTDVINLVVTGPFEISDNSLSWDTELFDLDPDFDGTIWVRYSPIAAGSDNGVITHSSDGFDDVLITLTGTGELPLVAIESENFDTGTLGNWTPVTVIGAQVWIADSGNAYMNGYSGGAQDNEDWLISPAMNFDAYENEVFSFDNAKNYSGPELEVYVSNAYTGDPSTTAWNLLTPALSTGSNAWVDSGMLDISSYAGTVTVAFKYVSSTSGAASWRVDDALIQGTIIQGVNTAPSIDTIVNSPLIPSATDTVIITANVTDVDGIASAFINWGLASDALTNDVAMTLDRSTYVGVIPAQAGGATVYYTITATDTNASPLTAVSGVQNYSVVMNVADIATLRAGATDGTIYCVTGEAVITFLQSYRGQKYIQDATGGILVDDNNGAITSPYSLYDGMIGICGTLNSYGGMLQFIPSADPGVATSNGNTVTPTVITLADMTNSFETYEAQVVTVNNVNFSDVGNFVNGSVYALSDGVDSYNFRSTFYDVDYIGTAIPSQPVNITGILNSRTDGGFFTARFLTDLDVSTTVVPAVPTNVAIVNEVNGIIISWDVAADAVSYMIYSASNPFALDVEWTLETITGNLSWLDIDNTNKKFYRVVSSTDALPVRR